jgi:hypothetical protein
MVLDIDHTFLQGMNFICYCSRNGFYGQDVSHDSSEHPRFASDMLVKDAFSLSLAELDEFVPSQQTQRAHMTF